MEIKDIQKLLNLKGFGPLTEDGKAGPKTELAIKKFQISRNLKADGLVGPKTVEELLVCNTSEVDKVETFVDQLSLQRISKLHPKLREECKKIMAEVNQKTYTKASFCRITFTLRTFAEQQAIYNQGRTTPGQKVTNAKPGQSIHNYGLAVDIAFVINGKDASWDVKKDWDRDGQSDWMEVVAVFKKYGWEWGGDWVSFKDMPHFQKTFGYSWQKLLNLKNAGKVDQEGYVII